MKKPVCLLFMLLFVILNTASQIAAKQSVEKGPYTVYTISKGVYHIEDATKGRPAGVARDKEGKVTGMNNCSDMYLVVGKRKALLIDLSNFLKYDNTVTESLRSIVYDRIGSKELLITITHKHGDHTGMMPAFKADPKARFWLPEAEVKGMDIFPKDRTIMFPENESLDLGGGFVIATTEVPGHTEHGTLFFLKGKNIVFSGDALGSGSGVWLLNYDSFATYVKSIDRLIEYLEDPVNKIDTGKLVIYGGHYWQKGEKEKLTAQYVYDMKSLTLKIKDGTAETMSKNTAMKYLDTDFKYGTATITWNKADAERYAESF